MSATVADVAIVRAGLNDAMVGRGAELRRLHAMAERLAATVPPEPQVAFVGGEAGVGKTRLVREFVASLERGPLDGSTATRPLLLVGHTEPGPLGRPFHVVQSALEPVVSGWTALPAALESRAHALRALLAPVAPALAGTTPAESRVVGEENLAAAVELVRVILDGRPGVFVAEDLHWADAESLLLIGRLATSVDLPLLVVATFRPAEGDAVHARRLAELMDRIGRQRMVEHIELSPLTQSQVAEWLAGVYCGPVPQRAVAELARRTGGNPFFLEELVASAPQASAEQLVRLPLPVSAAEAVLRHLDGLDADQRRIADAAAVLGRRIPFDLLASVTGAGEDELIDTMRVLVDRGLLVEIEPDVFGFRHALTREAVANRLLGRQRRRLHEKAYAALQEMGSDDWAALAYHASGAHLWEELVAAARAGATEHLQTGSTYEALRLAEAGLQEADSDVELLVLATRAAWACGLVDSAMAYATQWSRIADASCDDVERSRALRAISRLRFERGDRGGRDDVVARLLELAHGMPDCAELAAVYAHVAEVSMLAGRHAEAVEWSDRALELIGRGYDDDAAPALPAAMVNRGSAVIDMPGRKDEGAALLREAIDVAAARGDALNALRGANNLLQQVLVRWPAAEVEELIARAEALQQRFGWHDLSLAATKAAYYVEALGDIAAARAVLDRALTEPLEERPVRRAWLLAERAALALEAGEPDADAMVAEVRALDEASGALTFAGIDDWPGTLDVEIAMHSRDAGAAVAALDAVEQLAVAVDRPCAVHEWTWGFALLRAVRAGVAPERVRDVMHVTLGSDNRAPGDDDAQWTAHVEAALAAADGDHATAVRLYREVIAGRRRRPGMILDAELHTALARSLIATGELEEAREHTELAGSLLEKWEGWRVDEVTALRRRLESGTRSASGELTPREHDVALLVAEGLSNGEIGRRLFISTKTASVHVSNILAKLQMTSRAQIAAWASSELSRDAELVTPDGGR
jgi:DNA-binding CsgD family transcriptional regulator